MDDLDRISDRLLQNISSGYPEYLSRPFEVAEIYQSLVPYRHNRRELAMDTVQDYEVALCRLLTGERECLTGDEVMQQAIRRELDTNNPNTTIYRDFAAARVALGPALRSRTAATRPESVARESTAAGAKGASGGAQFAGSVAASEPDTRSEQASEQARPAVAPPSRPADERTAAAAGSVARTVERSGGLHAPERGARGAAASGDGGACSHCGGTLPEGRRVIFCPHCGQNLTVRRCPACGTELEQAWKFCVTCGRGADQG